MSADVTPEGGPPPGPGPAPAQPAHPRRARRRIAIALIVVASLLAFLAIFAIWANRQLLNTDNWAETSSQLLENDDIRTQVSAFVVDELYANVDVKSDLEQIFEQVLEPERAAVLAGPAAGGLRTLAENGVNRLLQRPRPQQLWEQANRRAQARFLQIVEGGGDVVSTSGGEVTLDLKSLLGQTQSNLGVGGRVEQKLPDDASQIVILQSDQLELAQDAVRLLKTLAVVLVVLSLALFALAIYLAEGWRREALRATGVGLLFAGAGALVARALAGDAVVNALATTDAVRPAVEATWSIGTSLMVQAATATVIYGVVVLFATWFAGHTRWARAARRDLAPYLREPRWAWGVFGVVVLGLLAWAPTPAFREVIPALALIGLLALGLEALRRQTAREYPDARREDSFRRVRGWVRGLGARIRGREDDSRLEQLERLGRLRDSGVLDAAEYEQEKGRLLAERAAV
jgi:Short C-terminal domain